MERWVRSHLLQWSILNGLVARGLWTMVTGEPLFGMVAGLAWGLLMFAIENRRKMTLQVNSAGRASVS